MLNLSLEIEGYDTDDLLLKLERIVQLTREGYTSAVEIHFNITGEEEEDPDMQDDEPGTMAYAVELLVSEQQGDFISSSLEWIHFRAPVGLGEDKLLELAQKEYVKEYPDSVGCQFGLSFWEEDEEEEDEVDV
jgi:hypothetical protein